MAERDAAMHIAVFGAGSLGSLLGGLLAGSHTVTLVGREPEMKAVASGGLRVTGELERTVHPATTTDWSGVADPDLVLVTVKSYDTDAVASQLARDPPSTILTLQNGIGPAETLAERLPKSTVLTGTVTYGARLEEPGVVACTGQGDVVIGAVDGGPAPAAASIVSAFEGVGIPTRHEPAFPRERWRKLAVNAAINPLTALAGVSNGAVNETPLQPIAVGIAHEVAAVARSQGVDLPDGIAERAVLEVASRTAANESSMARDLRRGQRTEIDAITGSVLRRANGVAVPMNEVLYALVMAADS